jgi:hypothetical protein
MATLDDRPLGWLRYLYRKTTTPDNWERGGRPHPHWDETTGEPMTSWHRFDLVDSSYAVALITRLRFTYRRGAETDGTNSRNDTPAAPLLTSRPARLRRASANAPLHPQQPEQHRGLQEGGGDAID